MQMQIFVLSNHIGLPQGPCLVPHPCLQKRYPRSNVRLRKAANSSQLFSSKLLTLIATKEYFG